MIGGGAGNAGRRRSRPSRGQNGAGEAPTPDGPCLAIGGPQKGNAKLFEIADWGDGVECGFKKKYGLQGNKIVFDIKGFFLNEY